MKTQIRKDNLRSKEGLSVLYKNIDLERLLKDYEEKFLDLRGCL